MATAKSYCYRINGYISKSLISLLHLPTDIQPGLKTITVRRTSPIPKEQIEKLEAKAENGVKLSITPISPMSAFYIERQWKSFDKNQLEKYVKSKRLPKEKGITYYRMLVHLYIIFNDKKDEDPEFVIKLLNYWIKDLNQNIVSICSTDDGINRADSTTRASNMYIVALQACARIDKLHTIPEVYGLFKIAVDSIPTELCNAELKKLKHVASLVIDSTTSYKYIVTKLAMVTTECIYLVKHKVVANKVYEFWMNEENKDTKMEQILNGLKTKFQLQDIKPKPTKLQQSTKKTWNINNTAQKPKVSKIQWNSKESEEKHDNMPCSKVIDEPVSIDIEECNDDLSRPSEEEDSSTIVEIETEELHKEYVSTYTKLLHTQSQLRSTVHRYKELQKLYNQLQLKIKKIRLKQDESVKLDTRLHLKINEQYMTPPEDL